jgi:nucleoside-diphosphate-sugar epimerase
MTFHSAVIVGATGATGIHLAAALRAEGKTVRVASRDAKRLDATFPDSAIEKVSADALDPASLSTAISGAEIAFDCIGLPGERMAEHAQTARNLADAVTAAGIKCVHVSSYWAYSPLQSTIVNEGHPRSGGSPWMRYRREAEDILLGAGAAVLHLPDFYGSHVGFSAINEALSGAVRAKPMNWFGPADNPREHIYVPDAMRIAVAVAENDDAYGEHWALPGAGPLTAEKVAAIAGAHLGRTVKVRAAGLGILRAISLFNKDLRGFMQMVPEYLKPVTYDATRLEGLIGKPTLTSYDAGIAATLDWLKTGG